MLFCVGVVCGLVILVVRRTAKVCFFFFLMSRRPPRSTLDRSSAASDVYKRQELIPGIVDFFRPILIGQGVDDIPGLWARMYHCGNFWCRVGLGSAVLNGMEAAPVSYTHLRTHETVLDIVCRLLLAKKHTPDTSTISSTRPATTSP